MPGIERLVTQIQELGVLFDTVAQTPGGGTRDQLYTDIVRVIQSVDLEAAFILLERLEKEIMIEDSDSAA